MLELYYYHDATCGIKARLALFEKGVEFDARLLDRFELTKPDYLAINPKAVVPTLIHDGEIIFESSVICLYVDDAFDGPPLKPALALDRARMYAWLKLIDEQYFKGIGSTTFALAIRKQVLKRCATEDELEAYFQCVKVDEYRQRRRSIIANGLDAPEVKDGLRVLATMLAKLDTTLGISRWAAGPEYSLADACLTPFIMRLEVLGLDKMWTDRPNTTDWWLRIQERPSFKRLVEESFPAQYFDDMHTLVGDAWPRVSQLLA